MSNAYNIFKSFDSKLSGYGKPEYKAIADQLESDGVRLDSEGFQAYTLWTLVQYGNKNGLIQLNDMIDALRKGFVNRDHRDSVHRGKVEKPVEQPASATRFFLNRKESIFRKAVTLPDDNLFLRDITEGKYNLFLTEEQQAFVPQLISEMEALKKAEKQSVAFVKKGYTVKSVSPEEIRIVIPIDKVSDLAQYGNGQFSPDDQGFVVIIPVSE